MTTKKPLPVTVMTLRDFFAAQALTAVMARGISGGENNVIYAYAIADAMLKQRDKP